MFAYFLRRLAGTIPVLILVSLFVFGFVRLLPGDPARLIAGPDASEQDVAAIRQEFGLDRPIWAQYVRYVGQLAHGNLVVFRSLLHKPIILPIPLFGAADRASHVLNLRRLKGQCNGTWAGIQPYHPQPACSFTNSRELEQILRRWRHLPEPVLHLFCELGRYRADRGCAMHARRD